MHIYRGHVVGPEFLVKQLTMLFVVLMLLARKHTYLGCSERAADFNSSGIVLFCLVLQAETATSAPLLV